MNWLYQATIEELLRRQDEIFDMPLWERSDYIAGEEALRRLNGELRLRRIWAE